MVAVIYTPVTGTDEGLDMTTLLAAGVAPGGTTGDSFVNTGKEKLYVINASASNAKTAVFEAVPCNYGTDHDPVRTIPISTTERFGPFPVSEFGDSIAVTYGGTGGVTDVKVLLIRDPFVN